MMNSNEKSNGRDFTKSNKETKETVLNHDLVILIDSNGKSILPEKLYPGYSVKKTPCMTIEKGFEIIDSAVFKKDPKIILLHTGTNNLDHEKTEALEDHLINLTSTICHRFPLSKVISSLLPRKDQPIGMVKGMNATLEQRTLHLPNAHFISHFCLFDKDLDDILIDNKYLKQHSFKRFVRNVEDCLLGGRSKSQVVRQNRNRGKTFLRKPRLQDNRYRDKVTWLQPPVRRRQDVPNSMGAVSFSNWNQQSQPFIPYSVNAAPFQQGRNMMNSLPPGNTQPNQSKVVQPNPMDNVSFNNFLHMMYEKVMC